LQVLAKGLSLILKFASKTVSMAGGEELSSAGA
jgi:hypothetical protein